MFITETDAYGKREIKQRLLAGPSPNIISSFRDADVGEPSTHTACLMPRDLALFAHLPGRQRCQAVPRSIPTQPLHALRQPYQRLPPHCTHVMFSPALLQATPPNPGSSPPRETAWSRKTSHQAPHQNPQHLKC